MAEKPQNIPSKLAITVIMAMPLNSAATSMKNRTVKEAKTICSERSECERINDYIKDTVKFNLKGTPNGSKELYSKLSFVAYQMMTLNNIQNGIEHVNSFARYF